MSQPHEAEKLQFRVNLEKLQYRVQWTTWLQGQSMLQRETFQKKKSSKIYLTSAYWGRVRVLVNKLTKMVFFPNKCDVKPFFLVIILTVKGNTILLVPPFPKEKKCREEQDRWNDLPHAYTDLQVFQKAQWPRRYWMLLSE